MSRAPAPLAPSARLRRAAGRAFARWARGFFLRPPVRAQRRERQQAIVDDLLRRWTCLLESSTGAELLAVFVGAKDGAHQLAEIAQLVLVEALTDPGAKAMNPREVAAARARVEEEAREVEALLHRLHDLLAPALHPRLDELAAQVWHSPAMLSAWSARASLFALPVELVAKRGGGTEAQGLRRGILVKLIAQRLPRALPRAHRERLIAGLLRHAGDAEIAPRHVSSILASRE